MSGWYRSELVDGWVCPVPEMESDVPRLFEFVLYPAEEGTVEVGSRLMEEESP